MAYLEAEKEKVLKQNIEQSFNSKRKHECEKAEKMEAKKMRLNQDIAALLKSADKLATSAELTGDTDTPGKIQCHAKECEKQIAST